MAVEEGRAAHESGRLLYVAATRARRRLHLLGAAELGSQRGEAVLRVPKRSFLELLWPAVKAPYEARFEDQGAAETVPDADAVAVTDQPDSRTQATIRRRPSGAITAFGCCLLACATSPPCDS